MSAMPYVVRPAEPQDYDPVIRLLDTLEPPCSAHLHVWRAAGEQSSAVPPTGRRWSVIDEATQRLVGSAAVRHERLDKFRVDLVVQPEWRGQGIGDQLLRHVETHLRSIDAGTVHTRLPEVATAALDFFQQRGFVETQRMCELRLNLRDFEPTRHMPLLAQIRASGFTISSLHDEEHENPRCWDELQELQNDVLVDWPDFDPGPVQRLEGDAFRRHLDSYHVIREGFFIAKDGQRYAGYSGLGIREGDAPGVVENTGTAVRHAYRGRHLATALKVHCLTFARQQGYEIAATRSGNPVMVRINENVGFQRWPGEVRLVKFLRG